MVFIVQLYQNIIKTPSVWELNLFKWFISSTISIYNFELEFCTVWALCLSGKSNLISGCRCIIYFEFSDYLTNLCFNVFLLNIYVLLNYIVTLRKTIVHIFHKQYVKDDYSGINFYYSSQMLMLHKGVLYTN